MPDILLDGTQRTAFVAGAGGGIGAATVAALLRAGARVAAADLAADSLPDESDAVLPLALDVTDEAAVQDAVTRTAERFGGIDFLINAAGVIAGGALVDMKLSEWRRVLEVNLTSCFLLARACYPQLRKSDRASVVLLSSTNGINGGSELSGGAYAVAKAGIINLTRHLAKHWAESGIRVNCLAPGPVDTGMIAGFSAAQHKTLRAAMPLGRYVTADEVAATILFLCSDHAAMQTGTVTNVSGGVLLD